MTRALPRLHAVTDDAVIDSPGFESAAVLLMDTAGPGIAVHLRGHGTAGLLLYRLAERLSRAAERAGSTLLVNDRLDVAMAAGAGGVQLGGRSLPVSDARALLGSTLWIGSSVHSGAAAAAAGAEGADFVIAGSLFSTPSHPGAAAMPERELTAVVAAGPPVIGIGGITPERVPQVMRAGSWGVAAIRGIWSAARPEAAAAEYLARIEDDE